jgi:phage terminase Nu1 subunit (DNA packaging protein)
VLVGAASGDLDLATERARLAREQADKIAMQNAQTRRELAPVVLIEEVLTKAASKTAGILDAIPGMIRRRVPILTADDIGLIAGEVAKARNMVAAMSLADLTDAADSADVSTTGPEPIA